VPQRYQADFLNGPYKEATKDTSEIDQGARAVPFERKLDAGHAGQIARDR